MIKSNLKVVIGRDARMSGEMLNNLVGYLQGLGIDVIDLGLSTTPTVEVAVTHENVDGGGIILTASHNPIEWNALKLLNHKGEFISGDDGNEILEMQKVLISYATVRKLGKHYFNHDYVQKALI